MASTKPKKKNPRLASGRKRVRQDVKINAANTSLRSQYRSAVKNVEKAVLAGDKAKATALFGKMQTVVDTVADKGIFHKNKAARATRAVCQPRSRHSLSRPPEPCFSNGGRAQRVGRKLKRGLVTRAARTESQPGFRRL